MPFGVDTLDPNAPTSSDADREALAAAAAFNASPAGQAFANAAPVNSAPVVGAPAPVAPGIQVAPGLAPPPIAPATAPAVPVASGAPAQPSQAPPEQPVAPVIPIRKPAPASAPSGTAPAAGGIPGQLGDLDKQIETSEQQQATALQNQAELEALGKQKEADERAKVADVQRQQAADLAAQQQYVRDRQAELNEIDRQNLEVAKNKTIPDFWSGREGEHVGASIGVLLAGIGAGFLGSTQNQAAEVIQHNTDKYFDRKKEEIDNLFKYASAQGLVNDKARDQYAKSITDLMQQHAAVLDAAKSRVEAVAAESQSEDAKARGAVLAAQLGAAAAKEHLGVADARIKWYDAQDANKAKLMEARAALIRASAEAAKARESGGGGEKADEQAFRTYVMAPHGKEAQTLNLRLSNIDSAMEDIKHGKSEGEVTKALEAVISADTGQGTRGVSQGQLHTIIPNLVSANGKISNAVSQNWNGTAGKEYRAAVLRLAQSVKDNREREYQANRANLEKSLALTPHGQKNPNFAKTSAAQLYPDRGTAAPAMESGTKTLRMPDGSIATFDASGKRIK